MTRLYRPAYIAIALCWVGALIIGWISSAPYPPTKPMIEWVKRNDNANH